MKRLFIQAEYFKKELDSRENANEILKAIEEEILKDPMAGKIVQGTGGIRKMRVADASRSKGKRSGFRVLYLDLPDKEHCHLIVFYGKDQADDLSSEGKVAIRQLVAEIKRY